MRLSCIVPAVPLVALAAALTTNTIRFENVTAKTGIAFVTDSSFTANKNQPETMVAGIAVFDYDRDGLPDLYFVNGARIPSLEKDSPRFYNRLYHNNGDGTFTDRTEQAGVAGKGFGMGVAAGDYDNDGWPDLYVANVTGNQLFHNNRDGTFRDVTQSAGVGGGVLDGKKMWSVAAAWLDYDNDGLLDLFVSNYCKWEVNRDPVCEPRPGIRAYCHPKNYAPLPNTLYRNNGDGTFTDVSAQTGISQHAGKGMGVALADYDHDGFTDIFVANDNMPNQLFHNLGGIRFEEVALQSGVAFGENGSPVSGMGAEFRDLDNDGHPDIWHTAIENETFPLFRNVGGGQFVETTGASNLGRLTRSMSGWANGVADLDNDGWKDLIVARGNVLDNVDQLGPRKFGEPNSIFRNLGGGKFEDVSASAGPGFDTLAPHRGVAYGDLDNDGRIDLVFSALNSRARVYRNVSSNANHWLTLALTGTQSNKSSIGAQVAITAQDGSRQFDMVTTSTGYGCSSDGRVHFGLGLSRTADIQIRWPSGVQQAFTEVSVDRVMQIQEPRK